MVISGFAHARRAVVVALALTCFGPAADLWAASLLSPAMAVAVRKSAEPFGPVSAVPTDGGLQDKWREVERRLDDERVQLALCDGDRERCVSPAALALLAIVDVARASEGRARLGEINRAINLAIRPMTDQAQYGQADLWNSPLVTFAHGAGDCEDYAIAKLVALRMAGLAAEDLRILVVQDIVSHEDHAVVAARLDGRWLTLDNRRMAMVEDADLRNNRPRFVIDHDVVLRYPDRPVLALNVSVASD